MLGGGLPAPQADVAEGPPQPPGAVSDSNGRPRPELQEDPFRCTFDSRPWTQTISLFGT